MIDLGGLPGSTNSEAFGINNVGQVVGDSLVGGVNYATEWSGGKVINLGPGVANSINDVGQVVGLGPGGATEWSGGKVIDLGGLPGSTYSLAFGINDAGQVVGYSASPAFTYATEWSHGKIINLGELPGSTFSLTGSGALSINDAGQAVGFGSTPSRTPVPESSTWAMMLLGFAGLAFAGYRRAKAGHATVTRFSA